MAAIRALVTRVKAAALAGRGTSEADLAEWEAWALEQADAVDPVRSGQVMRHIRPAEAG